MFRSVIVYFLLYFSLHTQAELRTGANRDLIVLADSLDGKPEVCQKVNFHEYQNIIDWALPMLSWTQETRFYGYIRKYMEPIILNEVYVEKYVQNIPTVGEYEIFISVEKATAYKVSDLKVNSLQPVQGKTNQLSADVEFHSGFDLDLVIKVSYGKTANNGFFVRIACFFYEFGFCGVQDKNDIWMDINSVEVFVEVCALKHCMIG